jgi:hypothetical protein
MARIIENWQMSWIIDLASGAPTSILAQNMLYANGTPDVVGNFDPHSGSVQWKAGDPAGNYFGGNYQKVKDPQCLGSAIASGLQSICTLTAIADASGNVVLQNPKPGTRGNLGQNVLEGPGTWSLDTSMSKAIQLKEGRRLQFRIDANNVLNHPQPATSTTVFTPDLNINSSVPFGNIPTKIGNRQFQAQVRLEF